MSVFSRCFFGTVLLMFLFCCVALLLRKLSEKILLVLGPRLERIFGRELLVFGCICSVDVFADVLPLFLLHCMALFAREPFEKILLFLGLRFEKLSGANSWFLVFVLCRYFLVTFCLCCCFIAWRCSSKSSRKKFSYS